MDCLYRAYSSPMDLMSRYINQGRFGTFVKGFLEAEYERRKAEQEKDREWMMWTAYVHSFSKDSYDTWKRKFTKPASTTKRRTGSDADLDEDGINALIGKLFPSQQKQG